MSVREPPARIAMGAGTQVPRSIAPEWLDQLAGDDPRAIRSRRDLRRINALMLNRRFIARELRRSFATRPLRTIAEIGAGDGSLMLKVARQLAPHRHTVEFALMDQQDLVSAGTHAQFASLGWRAQAVTGDVFEMLAQRAEPMFDVVVANLFLHHFDAAALRRLLALVAQRTRVLIACEPRRSAGALFGSRLLGLIGCNDVSRHDAVVSVQAGFNGQELAAHWPAGAGWTLHECAYGWFSHGFVAIRADGKAAGPAGSPAAADKVGRP